MREIASLEEMRKLWVVMKEFKILPNDERLLTLTEEQIDLILWSMILDNSKGTENVNVFHDSDFDKEWDEMEPVDTSKDAWEEV
jgi:hypothetical protein